MEFYEIKGKVPLRGEYTVKGAKNAVLPIMAASLIRPGIHHIYGCPDITDVSAMMCILREMGVDVSRESNNVVTIDSVGLRRAEVSREMMMTMRSSVFLLGALLARCGEASVFRPGGCKIGRRPIDIHITGLQKLGYQVEEQDDQIVCRGRCKGGHVILPYPSVGATENLMMAAAAGKGIVVIENCAREPEIVDLQGFLRCCGFRIYGAGGSRIIIHGRPELIHQDGFESTYFVIEDRIEAATYMMAVAGTGGDVLLRNIRPELLGDVLKMLEAAGAVIRCNENMIALRGPQRLQSPGMILTRPFPGFPTDCQPQALTMLSCADGMTTIREDVFESRFTHKKELMNMGADIEICGKNAIIKGVCSLEGKAVTAQDLRGGAALVLAGLMADGTTTVTGLSHIDRGYENFHKGLQELGGLIERRT